MYKETIYKLIKEVPNLSTLRIFYHMTTKEQFQGGIFTSKKAVADELNMSSSQVTASFKWLKENKYLTETKYCGQTKFIINKKEEPAEKVKEDSLKMNRPAGKIIQSRGKSITRIMIPEE